MSISLETHIADRLVTPRPDCQIWTAATDRGYGRISVDGRVRRVHRVVWEMKFGPIPEGLTIDHLCRVRACCNTDHMELVTGSENTKRAVPYRPRESPGVRRKACKRGHEFTDDNTLIHKGQRRCKTCYRAERDAYNERRRAERRAAAAESAA